MENTMRFAPGARLGDFEILEQLGSGAMGEVYRARDLKLGREVALKTVRSPEKASETVLARFRREAQALAVVNHPNIAAIYSLEESEGCMFLVMELVPGQTLAELMHSGLLPPRLTVQLALQIAEGLSAAHAKGIVHRDLKPSNIRITPEGRVKLLDFGLAKSLLGTPWGEETRADPGLHVTQEGTILGTPAYMSPEQAAGKAVDKRTDIWSFGVILYEMCAGVLPFSGETTLNTIALVLEREPDWNRLPRGTPQRLRDLIQRCLRKAPNRRLQDIGDARIELEAVRDILEPARGPDDASRSLARDTARSPPLDATEVLAPSSTVPRRPTPPPPSLPRHDSTSETTELRSSPASPTQVGDAPKTKHKPNRIVQVGLYSLLGVLVLVLAYALYDLFAPRDRLAVLAVAIPRKAPTAVEALGQQLREDLIAQLSTAPALTRQRREVSRAGVILTGKQASELARELKATWMLSTDVTLTDDALTLKVALVDGKLSRTLWNQTYRHPLPIEDAQMLEGWRKDVVADIVAEVDKALGSRQP